MDGKFEEALLHLFARQGRRIPVPVFCACAMIAALVASQNVGRAVVLAAVPAWLGVVAGMQVLRLHVLGRLADGPGPVAGRLRGAVVLSAVNGCVHALSLATFWDLSDLHRALQTLLLLGMCIGAIATSAGYRPMLLAYLCPVVGALIGAWALAPVHEGLASWVNMAVAFIIALLGIVLLSQAADAYRLFRESFLIRLEQASLNERLREALDHARLADQAKARFLASASHDLRQPLHTVSLFAAALAMRPLDAVAKEIAGHMNGALQVLTTELDALLDISRMDAQVVSVASTSIMTRPFLRRVQERYGPVAAARGVSLAVEVDSDSAFRSDEALLMRMVGNLVDNAIKYAPGGSVTVSACDCGQAVALLVADDGVGIPPPEQDRIFEEFYQLDNPERDRSKGLGLGLSIVSRLAHLLDVRLEMVSHHGAGTCFHLFLPRVALPFGAGHAPRPLKQLRGLRILVVEDEAKVRAAWSALMDELGAHLVLADGLAAARALCVERAPDLALVDMRLPGTGGLGVVDALRRRHPALPVLLISGDTSPEQLCRARRAGLPLLHKPVNLAQLLEAVTDLDPPVYEESHDDEQRS